ncbi:hypothetical protein [Burkholderia gladioli]|uniref:hypothetical protein n=1 Tax=Burkholderia gladioli TaxID=28095 RepID=UPI0016422924|nr:hypothetical protein [Burkholderia gladioli]MBU9426402.1 hypothetical protein [Burkholderia gladioli]MDN8063480.1 hypothetical protein [Burkholderia gladioli]
MVEHSAFLDLSSDAIAHYVRSLGRFTLARILADRAVPGSDDYLARRRALFEAAQCVQLEADSPRTIADLVADVRRRVRHSQIYEQWAADMLDAAHSVAKTLQPLCRDALMVALDAEELRRAAADRHAAIAEAYADLYGEDNDEYDPDDELCDDDAHNNDPGRLQAMLDDVAFGDPN